MKTFERNDWYTYEGTVFRVKISDNMYDNACMPCDVNLTEEDTWIYINKKEDFDDLMQTFFKGGWIDRHQRKAIDVDIEFGATTEVFVQCRNRFVIRDSLKERNSISIDCFFARQIQSHNQRLLLDVKASPCYSADNFNSFPTNNMGETQCCPRQQPLSFQTEEQKELYKAGFTARGSSLTCEGVTAFAHLMLQDKELMTRFVALAKERNEELSNS